MARVGRMRERGGDGAGGRSARRRSAGASPEKAARGYSAPKHTRFGPGGRGERCEAHQMLDDGGGAV
jgi:hypothetical protein